MTTSSDAAQAVLERAWVLESEMRLDEALALVESVSLSDDATIRADAAYTSGRIAVLSGDHDLGRTRYAEALRVAREEVPGEVAETMIPSILLADAVALERALQLEESRVRYEEAVAYRVATRGPTDYWLSHPLCNLAKLALCADESAAAVRAAAERALAVSAAASDDASVPQRLQRTARLHGARMLALIANTHWWQGDETGLFEKADECCAALGRLVADGLVIVPCTWADIIETELPGADLAECALMLAGAAASGSSAIIRERSRFRCARLVRLLEDDDELRDLREAWLAVAWVLRRAWGAGEAAADAAVDARSTLLSNGLLPLAPTTGEARWEADSPIQWDELWSLVIDLERRSIAQRAMSVGRSDPSSRPPAWTAWLKRPAARLERLARRPSG